MHPLEMANVAYGSCSPNLSLPGREQILLLRADPPKLSCMNSVTNTCWME